MQKQNMELAFSPELTRQIAQSFGWVLVSEGADDEWKVFCPDPKHDDKHPSASLNVGNGKWNCKSCGAAGDLIHALALMQTKTREEVIREVTEKFPELVRRKRIDVSKIEKYHTQLLDPSTDEFHARAIEALAARGIDTNLIRKGRIGFRPGKRACVTIPIFNATGTCVALKEYRPWASGRTPKFSYSYETSKRGHHLYYFTRDGVDQLQFEKILICGGELKALAAAGLLNRHKVGAISSSGGEGHWSPEWTPLLFKKQVFICLDIDDPGIQGSQRLANFLSRPDQPPVRLVKLPLDRERYPKGDISDYIGREKASGDDLLALLESAKEYEPPKVALPEKPTASLCDLVQVPKSQNYGKAFVFDAIPVARSQDSLAPPCRVRVTCDRQQAECGFCPVHGLPQTSKDILLTLKVPTFMPGFLTLLGAEKKKLQEGLKEALTIPPTCPSVYLDPKEYVQVWPEVFLMSTEGSEVDQSAVIVHPESEQLEMGTRYRMCGVYVPNPKNGKSALLIDEKERLQDNIDTFSADPDELEELRRCSPAEWTVAALDEKLAEMHLDISHNVTKIYDRPELHLAVDLTYFSCLSYQFDGKSKPGWLRTLLIGDSGQGKTEVTTKVMEHYGLGEKIDCKTTTFAGLVGGLMQRESGMVVRWGKLPANDRRLLILEELKGMRKDEFAKTTEIRQSGEVKLSKIQGGTSRARVRQIYISNPRNKPSMSQYPQGIIAVTELMGSPEDVRRLDLVTGVKHHSKWDWPKKRAEHRLFADICQRHVLWAWSRTEEQIVFEDEAADAIIRLGSELEREFDNADIPLLGSDTYDKLCKLSAALAMRTFSTGDNLYTVLVRLCHVEYMVRFIRRNYGSPSLRFQECCDRVRMEHGVQVDDTTARSILEKATFPKAIVERLRACGDFNAKNFEEWTGCEREQAKTLLGELLQAGYVLTGQKYLYHCTEAFQDWLRTYEPPTRDFSKGVI